MLAPLLHRLPCGHEALARCRVDEKVVAIAHEGADSQIRANAVVYGCQHRIGPNLRGEVTNGQPVGTTMRGEQVIAREVMKDGLARAAGPHDSRGKPAQVRRGAGQDDAQKNLVVGAREKLGNRSLAKRADCRRAWYDWPRPDWSARAGTSRSSGPRW
jgi:hypothetical protein